MMRLGSVLLVVATPFLFGFVEAYEDPRKFQAGDRVLVLGRLAECKSWSGRPLEVEIVPESGEVELLGLPAVALLGKSPKMVEETLLRLYHDALPERSLPLLGVRLLRGDAEYEHWRILHDASLWQFILRECSSGPPSSPDPHDQAPIPGIPGLLDEIS
jgi:hypothetical protein